MAFKSIDIRLTTNLKRPMIGVFDPVYCGKPLFRTKHDHSRIRIHHLPKAAGFSYDMQPPYVDFKTLRAMLNGGVGDIARRVISTKTRSWITPDFIFDNLLGYCYPTKPRFDCPVYKKVLAELEYQFSGSEKLMPLTLNEGVKTIPQNTSPGLPYINLYPGKKKGEILEQHFNSIAKDWNAVGNRKKVLLPDCAAFARSHIGNAGDNKVRPVWAYPLTLIAAESMFATPILHGLKNQHFGRNTAYGMEMMKGGMEWLDNQCKRARLIDPGCKFLMTDYSAFDSTVPAWLIRDCFRVIRSLFDFSENPAYYINILKRLESYFINTPVRNSDGRRILTDHGIPSGSMFTNIIGTMVNFIVTRYIIKRLTLSDPMFDIYFGDDGLICLRGTSLINMQDFKVAVDVLFGMNINVKKSFWTTKPQNIHFLGYYNNRGTPFKPSTELFASMLYPQHFQDDWAYTMSRALGCLYASAGNNQDVYKAVHQIFMMSNFHDGKAEKGLELIRTHPRMIRHINTMGLRPEDISFRSIHDYRLTLPKSDCTKIVNNVYLV